METPFLNDMFALVYQSFHNLWPDKKCSIWWEPEIRQTEDGKAPMGLTDFGDDGTIAVFVSPDIPVRHAVEILAHELAHVAVGVDADHGSEWEKAFDAIFDEYNKVCKNIMEV